MKYSTLVILTLTSLIAILSLIGIACNTATEAQDVIAPATISPNDLTAILERMPIADVKAAILNVNPEIRAIIGVGTLNSLNDVSDTLAFDNGKLLNGEVRDGAAAAVLDEIVNECLTEIPTLTTGKLTDAQIEAFVNSHCFTNMRLKFKDLNPIYAIVLERVLSQHYTLPPL